MQILFLPWPATLGLLAIEYSWRPACAPLAPTSWATNHSWWNAFGAGDGQSEHPLRRIKSQIIQKIVEFEIGVCLSWSKNLDLIGQAATLVTPVLGLFCDLGTETQAQKDLQRPDHVGGVVVGLFVSDGRVQKELLIFWSSRQRYNRHIYQGEADVTVFRKSRQAYWCDLLVSCPTR